MVADDPSELGAMLHEKAPCRTAMCDLWASRDLEKPETPANGVDQVRRQTPSATRASNVPFEQKPH